MSWSLYLIQCTSMHVYMYFLDPLKCCFEFFSRSYGLIGVSEPPCISPHWLKVTWELNGLKGFRNLNAQPSNASTCSCVTSGPAPRRKTQHLPRPKMKIPYAALWWERPKLSDGAAFESVATVEILFQKQTFLCILEQRELEKRRQGQKRQAGGYTFATNLQ